MSRPGGWAGCLRACVTSVRALRYSGTAGRGRRGSRSSLAPCRMLPAPLPPSCPVQVWRLATTPQLCAALHSASPYLAGMWACIVVFQARTAATTSSISSSGPPKASAPAADDSQREAALPVPAKSPAPPASTPAPLGQQGHGLAAPQEQEQQATPCGAGGHGTTQHGDAAICIADDSAASCQGRKLQAPDAPAAAAGQPRLSLATVAAEALAFWGCGVRGGRQGRRWHGRARRGVKPSSYRCCSFSACPAASLPWYAHLRAGVATLKQGVHGAHGGCRVWVYECGLSVRFPLDCSPHSADSTGLCGEPQPSSWRLLHASQAGWWLPPPRRQPSAPGQRPHYPKV